MVVLLVDDHGSRPSSCVLGLPFRRPREQKEEVLLDVQRVQARALPPLLCLQPMCAQHGPSLSLDQQLRRLLEPQVLHSPPDLRVAQLILCLVVSGVRLLDEHQVGGGRFLFQLGRS